MIEKYYNELLGYFSHFLKDKDRAQDVVQESYSRVLSISNYEEKIKEPRAFLYKTARNIINNEYNKNIRQKNTSLENIQIVDDSTLQPLEELESQERINKLNQAIQTLPPRCYEAFTLYKFEGLNQAQIAKKMGISKNMVEKHIINAMKICNKCLKEINE